MVDEIAAFMKEAAMANEFSPDDVKSVWQNQNVESFRMSIDEIRRKIEQFDTKIRRRNFIAYAACFIVIAYTGWCFFFFPNLIQRIGSILTVLGTGYLVYQARLNQLQKRAAVITGTKMRNAVSVEFYRAELQWQRDFHRGIWLWSRLLIFAPGPLVFILGFEIAHPELATIIRAEGVAILFLAALAVPLNLTLARKYQKQIDELESLQRENNEEGRSLCFVSGLVLLVTERCGLVCLGGNFGSLCLPSPPIPPHPRRTLTCRRIAPNMAASRPSHCLRNHDRPDYLALPHCR